MRRAFLFAIGTLLAWRLLRRRGRTVAEVTVGWADGSSVTLDPGSPERERILALAADELRG